ncbi:MULTISPECIES: DUF6291 domain-containing protein [unclassified Carboxylicivirga]|uniref:DUF6291 domain-containing protein n=1 Tax=Carboxylicivirga TaxID=1628153 RepID=UPI003D330CD8
MAVDKKSFLLYTDLIHTVSQLPDDKAGALFKHILEYVNDNNPQTDDIIVKIAFEPIKQGLKRDLKKYEEIKKKRSEAGKASARKRQQESTSVEQSEQMPTHVESVEQTSTKSTVNDNVNVSVNDNVLPNGNEKKSTPKSPKRGKPPMKLDFPYSSDKFMKSWDQLLTSPKWKKKIQAALQISLNKLGKYEEAFAIELMDDCFSAGWQGVVFPDTDEKYQKWLKNKGKGLKPGQKHYQPSNNRKCKDW